MFKLVLSTIIAIGTAFLRLWKKYGSKETKIKKLLDELETLRIEMDNALRDSNFAKFHSLSNRRMRVNEKISRLHKR